MERTLILVKPDAFARSLTGEIIARFERKGLRLVALQHADDDPRAGRAALRRARGQAVLRASSSTFITSGPLVAMVLEGDEAVVAARQVIGATEPARGDAPARSAATSRSRSARTWSTARTRPSRPRARSALFFPDLGSGECLGGVLAADPRLALAPAAGDPRAARRRVHVEVVRDVEELDGGPAARGRGRERLRKAAAVAADATGGARSSASTRVVALGGADLRQAGRRGRGAGDAERARRPHARRWSAGCA